MVETVFSANNRQEVFVLPFTPVEMPVSEPQNNSTFDGLSMGRGVIGTLQPAVISYSSRFFKNRPSWAHPMATAQPMEYVEFFRRWRGKKVPIRITITAPDREILNMAVLVDDFQWQLLKNLDIAYSISLTEYTFIN